MKKKKSPCIGICKFEGPELWCLGCGRTRPDCKKWKQLETDEQRAKFLEIFEKRKEKMRDLGVLLEEYPSKS